LGRALVEKLAAPERHVFIHFRESQGDAEELVLALKARGCGSSLVMGDLAKPTDVSALAKMILNSGHTLRTLVHNVGRYPLGELQNFDPVEFSQVLQVNLTAPFALTQALLPRMDAGSHVVHIGYAGVESLAADTHNTAYLISKTGLLVLTKSWAQALGPRGIRVNMVSPGILENSVELPRNPGEWIPLGRLGRLNDVAEAVAFLDSEAGSYITGINLDVSGGYMLGLKSLPEGETK
jgi:NAD(P)-dependent dehydrogenase (short-subunit alcohol dehydrogenase family)